MIHQHEYSKAEDNFVQEIFNNVRPGGPKETRLRHSFLEGKLEPRKIFHIKVSSEDESITAKLRLSDIVSHFEEQGKEVAESYIPLNSKTHEPWDFMVVGFYKQKDMEELEKIHSQSIAGCHVIIEHVDGWFTDIYPNPNQRRGSIQLK